MRKKTVFKRISIFFLVFVLLFCVVFFSFNKPKTVKAVAPIAIGGAAALLFSALAAQGVAFNFSGLDQSGLNDMANTITDGYTSNGKTWADWRDDYSNIDGSFNWASLFVSKDTQATSAVFSNEFLKWFQDLPDFINGRFHFSTGTSTPVVNSSYVVLGTNRYPVFPSSATTAGVARQYNAVPDSAGTYDFQIKENLFYRFTLTAETYYNYSWKYQLLTSSDGDTWTSLYSGRCTRFFVFGFGSDGSRFGWNYDWNKYAASDSFVPNRVNIAFNDFTADIDNIGMDGTLTDGYQDLQDALDQELQDKATAGYGDTAVGVIDLGNVDGVTAEQKIDNLINRVISNSGTIAGTGVGVWDNDDVYEEDENIEKVPTATELDKNIILVDGLEDFFPFCIPFDLYEIVNLLNVAPEAPKFNWKMSFSGRVDDYDIFIDLTPYNTVATVFRTMIIIVFLIFLTLKTRDLIRG